MIRLAEPKPHLLPELEERHAQQTNRYSEKNAGSVFMPDSHVCGHKSHDEE
jgi:hypothetical protein